MSINKNWTRWIFASIGTFYKNAMPNGQVFAVEGQLETEEGDYIELRLSGPNWYGCVNKRWYADSIVANFLVKVVKDEKDAQKIYRTVGLLESLIAKCITVMKYGDTADDNRTVSIGELQLYPINNRDIRTEHYGQLVSDIPSIQSTVEVHYRTNLDE